VLAAVAAILVAILVVGGWFVWQLDPPGAPGDPVTVEIKPGWSAAQAGDALADTGVIGSPLAFRIWSRASGASLQAGTYRMRQDLGVRGAADRLDQGPVVAADDHYRLLLPPGLTLAQIAKRVGELPGHDAAAFSEAAQSGVVRSRVQPAGSTSLEGLTWPDTYFVAKDQTDEEILQRVVAEFDTRATAAGLGTVAVDGLTPYEVVTLASLVQAEAGTAADAPVIAGVILNRLRQGIPLQIDATLCYAKGGCPPVPTNADKELDSPYNTYRVVGLTPTPIMTVTEQSLRAALAPAAVPYLFYVAGPDGVSHFATTFEEHQRNIEQYCGEACQ
jgi:peptidoglycan lytic transglycosylase G